MAYKMSQEFPTASLDITFTCRHFCLVKPATRVKTDVKTKQKQKTNKRKLLRNNFCADRTSQDNDGPSELHKERLREREFCPVPNKPYGFCGR